ncbi:MAG: PqqD family protein [Eubacteriales bacterium]|jgi:nicotinamide riboside kinase
MARKSKPTKNYLEQIPVRADLAWSTDDQGIVTLQQENRGVFHWLAQKLLKRPRISYIHLDEMGSFLWPLMDGQRDVYALAQLVQQQFGEKAEPLYPRIVKYFQILESYDFIKFQKD